MKFLQPSRGQFGGLLIAQTALLIGATQISGSVVGLDCPIRSALGVQCPGCGITRCITALGEGDVLGAMRYNPLVTAVAVGLVLFCGYGLVAPQRASTMMGQVWVHQKAITLIVVVVILSFTVARNLIDATDATAFVISDATGLKSLPKGES